MYKQNFALDNPQELICIKYKKNNKFHKQTHIKSENEHFRNPLA